MAKENNITISDIANMSGVSIATISRILNNKGNVKEETPVSYTHLPARGKIQDRSFRSSSRPAKVQTTGRSPHAFSPSAGIRTAPFGCGIPA